MVPMGDGYGGLFRYNPTDTSLDHHHLCNYASYQLTSNPSAIHADR